MGFNDSIEKYGYKIERLTAGPVTEYEPPFVSLDGTHYPGTNRTSFKLEGTIHTTRVQEAHVVDRVLIHRSLCTTCPLSKAGGIGTACTGLETSFDERQLPPQDIRQALLEIVKRGGPKAQQFDQIVAKEDLDVLSGTSFTVSASMSPEVWGRMSQSASCRDLIS